MRTKSARVLTITALTLAAAGAVAYAAMLAAPAPRPRAVLAYAHVAADGTLQESSGNVTVSRRGDGMYCMGVSGGTAQVAVASLDSHANRGGTVQAGVFHASGCPANATDIWVVTRGQAQDGGQPGTDRAFYLIVD